MNSNQNRVSVIIPAYNEEKSIRNVINRIGKAFEKLSVNYEIIVINDGSEDSTSQEARKSCYPIRLIEHEQNRGYGSAIKTGIKVSKYPWIIIIDADGSYPEHEIVELVRLATENDFDMVVGARTKKDTGSTVMRKIAKFFLTKLANYLTGTKIPDINSGLRILKKDIVNKFISILPDTFSFTTTITLAMLTNGYKVMYYPIEYYKRIGKSKINPIVDLFNFLQLIIRTVIYFDPLKVFLPVSLILFLMAVVAFIIREIRGGGMAITIVIFLMSSLHMLAIGMLADLIDKRLKVKQKDEERSIL